MGPAKKFVPLYHWPVLLTLAVFPFMTPARADDWPQWLGPRRDGVWRETGILDKFPAQGPTARWRAPVGAGYSGPAVAGGRVFVTDRILAADARNPASPFARNEVSGKERVLCFNEPDGKPLWVHAYDCPYQVSYALGPRASPVVHDGKAYTLGTMGDLYCLDAASGQVLWSKNFPRDLNAAVPMWGFAAHPLIDGDRLICLAGGKGSLAVAFHKDTGKEVWRALSAPQPGYCPPMIHEVGTGNKKQRQLIVWHPEAVNALDPETGRVYWSQPFAVREGLTIPAPRLAGDRLFVSSFYNGSMMLQLAADGSGATVAWKGKSNREMPAQTDGLHALMCTPFMKDGYIYGVCSYGQLRCLKADTGARVWESLVATGGKLERWGHAFIVAHEDRFFLFNEKGDLIIARLSPKGYEELSRAHLVDPSNHMARRPVVWSHPAFAHRSVYVRNDRELACVALAGEKQGK